MEVQDERNNLINEICIMLNPEDMQDMKTKLFMAMSKYEITNRSTEVAVLDSDRNENLLKRFLIAKKVSGRTERTIKFYGETIRKSLETIGKSVDDITPDDIRMYIALRLKRDKVSEVTISNETRNLSSFFSWLHAEELIMKNPMNKVDKFKKKKTKKEALTELEVEKLRMATNNEREKMILEVLLSTGCRVTEFVNILLTDIDGNRVLVHGKGKKDRYCYLNARAALAIEIYMNLRKDSNPYLNPRMKEVRDKRVSKKEAKNWWKNPDNIDVGHSDQSTVEYIMRKMAQRAGVERANPHKLRRTCATMALKRGMPLTQVSKMLGHEDLSTTQIYLDLSEDDLAQAHKKYVC